MHLSLWRLLREPIDDGYETKGELVETLKRETGTRDDRVKFLDSIPRTRSGNMIIPLSIDFGRDARVIDFGFGREFPTLRIEHEVNRLLASFSREFGISSSLHWVGRSPFIWLSYVPRYDPRRFGDNGLMSLVKHIRDDTERPVRIVVAAITVAAIIEKKVEEARGRDVGPDDDVKIEFRPVVRPARRF